MTKKDIRNIPFPPLVKIDTDEQISVEQVTSTLKSRLGGISICVRSKGGNPHRGGYFFHILPKNQDLTQCELYNFEKIPVYILPVEQITIFINHASGLEFNQWAFDFCQSVVNFRLDPES